MSHILKLEDISVSFGGIHALQGVNLQLDHGSIHALIGPNGAGKTTLVSVLSGELKPNGGVVHFDGRSVNGLSTHERARLGLTRTYQITALFQHIAVWENILLSLKARDTPKVSVMQLLRAHAERHYAAELAEVLKDFGLEEKAGALPSALSHGDRRRLELAMEIISNPSILQLDEPLAGLSTSDAAELVALIRKRLKGDVPILLIEHDMDAVFDLADEITVLVDGRVLMTGTPEAVRNSAEVQAAYLSEEDDF
ncbi:MAG: ABC transporter ATP-binding protein [Roseovarius indicus]